MKQLEILFSKTVNLHSFADIADTISRMRQEIIDLPESEMELRTKMGRNVSVYLSDNTLKALGTIQSAIYKPDQLPVMLIAAMAYLQRNPGLLDAVEGLYLLSEVPESLEEEVPNISEEVSEPAPFGGPKVPEASEVAGSELSLDQTGPKKRGRKSGGMGASK